MVAHHVATSAMAAMIRLDALMMLTMRLVAMVLLLVAVQQGHALLAAGTTIQPGIVTLLMVLGIHALAFPTGGIVRWGFDWGGYFVNELAEEGV